MAVERGLRLRKWPWARKSSFKAIIQKDTCTPLFQAAVFTIGKTWNCPSTDKWIRRCTYIQWDIAAAAKSLQSCPTLCNPIDGLPPGSPIPGILQATTLEWVAISFSNAWKWKWGCSVMSDSSRPHGLQPTRLLRPWDFPGKSTGVGYYHKQILPF